MVECFYNKFHPSLPQCKNEGKPLPMGRFLSTGNGTDSWTWCVAHSKPFVRDLPPNPAAQESASE